MKLEGVIVSIQYWDYLAITLPNNKQYFDKLVVVTDSKDIKTKKICELNNVECVVTDDFYLDDPKIANKARGINKGLEKLSKDGWVVQLDADIWLPPLFRSVLSAIPLEVDKIYGMDRMMCKNYLEWFKFSYLEFRPIHEAWIYLHLDSFPIGQRVVQYKGEGYLPIGFFQLWNPKGSKVLTYPEEKSGYDRTDIVMAKLFPRYKRGFIPDLACVHLDSGTHTTGKNWFGRKTKQFLPNPIVYVISTFLGNILSFFGWILYTIYKLFSSPINYIIPNSDKEPKN